jgi:hypothetical protein
LNFSENHDVSLLLLLKLDYQVVDFL